MPKVTDGRPAKYNYGWLGIEVAKIIYEERKPPATRAALIAAVRERYHAPFGVMPDQTTLKPFARDVFVRLALRICLLASALLTVSPDIAEAGQRPPSEKPENRATSSTVAREKEKPNFTVVVQPPAETPVDAARRKVADEREQADLKAQLRMADSSEAAVRWSVAQAVVSVLGFALLIWTLVYTRQATRAATTSADAAKVSADVAAEALRSSESTTIRQLRAYLDVGPPLHSRKDHPTEMRMTIKNAGLTPAYHVASHLNWYWQQTGDRLPAGFDWQDYQSDSDRSIAILGPGAETTFRFPIKIESVEQADRGESVLFFYGHVTYRDAFERSRQSTFCYRYYCEGAGETATRGVIMYHEHNDSN